MGQAKRRQDAANKAGVPLVPQGKVTKTSKGEQLAVIGYCHPVGEVGARFHGSCFAMAMSPFSKRLAGRLAVSSGAQIVKARTQIVRQFLETPNFADVDWLWMVDADMEFPPETLERLIQAADPIERPLVGALCFALMKGEVQEVQPTIYCFQGTALKRQMTYPLDQLFRADATGAGCVLIHRSVLEGLQAKYPKPYPWFEEVPISAEWGAVMSEDIIFFLRAREAGFKLHIDSRIKIGHVKPVVVDETMFFEKAPKPEVPAETFVVIPVKGRHELTNALLAQLAEQGEADSIFVYDNGSESDPYDVHSDDNQATVIPAEGWSIHEMWNDGIKRATDISPRCNVAILNNDIVIGDEFLSRLANVLRVNPKILAVCPNYDGRDFDGDACYLQSTFKNGGLSGFAFMVRGEAYAANLLQPFPTDLKMYFGDDDLMAQIAKVQGFAMMVKGATVEHVGGGSQTASMGTGDRYAMPGLRDALEHDGKVFLEKWGHY